MKIITVLSVFLIGLLSGCIDEKITGTYASEKTNSFLKFIAGGAISADNNEATLLENYKTDGDTVIISYFKMAYPLKIQDNGTTLTASEGTKFTEVWI